jgi:phosphate starvation-inducible PhoH-like protein
LNDAFIILDEAQNTTSEQMKMFLTRIGGSRPSSQGHHADRPAARQDLEACASAAVLSKTEGIRFVLFNERDVVRHARAVDHHGVRGARSRARGGRAAAAAR